jgi:hypothetical protein
LSRTVRIHETSGPWKVVGNRILLELDFGDAPPWIESFGKGKMIAVHMGDEQMSIGKGSFEEYAAFMDEFRGNIYRYCFPLFAEIIDCNNLSLPYNHNLSKKKTSTDKNKRSLVVVLPA